MAAHDTTTAPLVLHAREHAGDAVRRRRNRRQAVAPALLHEPALEVVADARELRLEATRECVVSDAPEARCQRLEALVVQGDGPRAAQALRQRGIPLTVVLAPFEYQLRQPEDPEAQRPQQMISERLAAVAAVERQRVTRNAGNCRRARLRSSFSVAARSVSNRRSSRPVRRSSQGTPSAST